MKTRRPWSLRRRLVLTIAAVVCGGMAWLMWWQSVHLQPRWWQAMEASLVDTATVLAATVAQGSPAGTPDPAPLAAAWDAARARPVQALIYGTRKDQLELEVSLTDRFGKVLYDSVHPDAVGRDHSRWNDVLRTLRGEYGARATRADPEDPASQWLHVAAPVRQGAEVIGVLTASKPVGAVAGIARQAELELAFSALAVTAAMAGLALLITAWVTIPLARLTEHLRRAARGIREPLPELGRGEIAELGAALQDLRRELDGRAYVEGYVQTLTHELKSPLAGIRAAAELLQEDLPAAERLRFLANVRGEGERAQALIERLLGLAAIERREALRDPAPVELKALVEELMSTLAARAAAARVGWVVNGDNCTVLGERFLLSQALENLLINALDFAPADSVVTVDIGPSEVRVRDRGPGIQAYALPRLGERFFSLPRPHTGRKGTGLGLAFARSVAALHGGACVVTNAPDGGAEAVFRVA